MMEKEAPVPTAAAPATSTPERVVVPNRPSFIQRLGARTVWFLIHAVSLTLRYRWTDRSEATNGPAIYGIWHNRLVLCLKAYFPHAQKRGQAKSLAVMISASKDGGFLSGIFECFGVQPVRGSTSRRGRQALLELTRWARRGHDLGITPDGPRGPCYVVQDGVMYLAQLTGMPIVPMTYRLGWKIRVKSWDRFQIPLPFSRCEILYGELIRVPREASDAEREALRQKLELTLKELSGD